ncbi:hypothetical protein SGQ83_01565 [Flavobacterium sp. Fl-318]|uniref:Uncharacterized protein n=1 Tax=Flavobacterium cupriresistens TaxID=2893885 RepID=A0ABU4R620_9FLAO|nr:MULTISPECIES: hypothetical protein [unclassified Flavobacterium]MDX6188024.1 hypothetical protein [Flavobacterium sp. Fl-318]UFH42056.1 hypothetical protein LNP23_19885 [Flavobacterium sp. F-323]
MKYLFILILFCQNIFCQNILSDNSKKISIIILDSKLEDGQFVNVKIKNNSKLNYCFVIDTSFYTRNRLSYDGNFENFSIYLYKNGIEKKIPASKEVTNHIKFKDSIVDKRKGKAIEKKNDTLIVDEYFLYKSLYKNGFVRTLSVIKVKSGKSIYLRIPFNLVIKYLNQGVNQYYNIDRTKKYSVGIEYMIKQEYIDKYIHKKEKNSFENEGYTFFIGSLVSNNVSLVLK